jgi:beta-glucosidase
MIFINDGHS